MMINRALWQGTSLLDNTVIDSLRHAWPMARWRDVHVVIGVSGGTDSMALLRAMLTIKGETGGIGQLHVVHIDHGLRGPDSIADARWLTQQCELLGIPLTVCQSDVRALADSQGDGLEAAARNERYQHLTLAAERTGARYVVTGHNANDQAETILFRILRGSGLRGLAGIRKYRPLSPSVTLVRPLLGCWRKDLKRYLNSLRQPYREDLTNKETQFKRNRIRLDLLPQLRSDYNVRIDEALLHLSEQATAAGQFIETEAEKLLALCNVEITLQPTGVPLARRRMISKLHTAPLKMQSELLVCEVMRLAWRQALLPEQAMTQQKWQQLARLAQTAATSAILNLPGKVQATVSDGQLVLAQR